MNCLMDNDAILKLAATQLLEDWQKQVSRPGHEIRVAASAKHFFRKNKDLPLRYGAAAIPAAIAFAERATTVSEAAHPKEFELLNGVPGIDPGEAILFSDAVGLPEYVVVSGDKIGMKALQQAAGCDDIRRRLKGRVIAFEQVVLALLQGGNFTGIREQVVAAERVDKVLQVAFGLGLETTLEKATEALEHYIAALRRQTGDLLITSEELEQLLAK
jgi:hypothetical protein